MGRLRPPFSVLGAEARQFELEEPERQEDCEGEADDAGDVRERQEARHRRVLGNDEEQNEREDRSDFVQADGHGLPFQQTARADACRCEGFTRAIARKPYAYAKP